MCTLYLHLTKNIIYDKILKMNNKLIPTYLKIEKDIRDKIEKKKLKSGEMLPPEKELCIQYKVSRMTLRKALSILSSEGYIYKIPGRGTFVTSPDDKEFEDIIKKRNTVKKMNKGVGILVPCITFSIFAGIVRGAEDTLRENNYHIILGNYDGNPKKEKEYIETFLKRGVSGFIISPNYFSFPSYYNNLLKKREIPFVFTDITINGVETDLVATDNFEGGYIGTKYLISLGCKKIAFISGYLSLSSSKGRFEGYKKNLSEAKILFRKELIKEGDTSEEFGYEATKELFNEEKIDGIFSANEPITIGVLKAIDEIGAKIPEEVKVVSFDEPNLPPGLNYPIALIKQPKYEIGKTAAEILLERIKEKRRKIRTPYKKILLKPEMSKEEIKI